MTVEEYLALVNANSPPKRKSAVGRGAKPAKPAKRKGKAAKGMSEAMKEANDRLRTKSGKLRKGRDQADIARLAHKIRRQKYA